jgi:hypothetical protein
MLKDVALHFLGTEFIFLSKSGANVGIITGIGNYFLSFLRFSE